MCAGCPSTRASTTPVDGLMKLLPWTVTTLPAWPDAGVIAVSVGAPGGAPAGEAAVVVPGVDVVLCPGC